MSNSTELHEKDENSKIEGKWGKGKGEKKFKVRGDLDQSFSIFCFLTSE